MATHLEASLEFDIRQIQDQLTEMASRAAASLRQCVRAIVENNRSLAYGVMLRDQYIDVKE